MGDEQDARGPSLSFRFRGPLSSSIFYLDKIGRAFLFSLAPGLHFCCCSQDTSDEGAGTAMKRVKGLRWHMLQLFEGNALER